jgi:hypothetical protein
MTTLEWLNMGVAVVLACTVVGLAWTLIHLSHKR